MSKEKFLQELRRALDRMTDGERREILSDYEEHFRMGVAEGKKEDEIAQSLGNPRGIGKSYAIDTLLKDPKKGGRVTARGNVIGERRRESRVRRHSLPAGGGQHVRQCDAAPSPDAQFILDARSTSGDISCKFPIIISEHGTGGGNHVRAGVVGSGPKAAAIRTVSGDIRIEEQGDSPRA